MGAVFIRMSADDRHDAPADATATDAVLASRRKAAAYLRAAKLTDDPAQREELRHKAAELIAPRHKTSDTARDAHRSR